MIPNNTTFSSDGSKKIRYEPIERRKTNRRHADSDRRKEVRADQEEINRRQNQDRRKNIRKL